MKLGDQPAFAIPSTEEHYRQEGMTYRQWLIGMIAPSMNDEHWNQYEDKQVADWIISRADAIIARMEGEGK